MDLLFSGLPFLLALAAPPPQSVKGVRLLDITFLRATGESSASGYPWHEALAWWQSGVRRHMLEAAQVGCWLMRLLGNGLIDCWPIDGFIGWFIDWFAALAASIDWLIRCVDWFVYWVVGWLFDWWFVGWFSGWLLIGCAPLTALFIAWLTVDWFVYWAVDWFGKFIGRFSHGLLHWLLYRSFNWSCWLICSLGNWLIDSFIG